MKMRQIAVLTAVPVLIFCVSVGGFALAVRPLRAETPAPREAYFLGEENGRLALYRQGDPVPVARYDIYLDLLPEMDAAALRQGIPVASAEELYSRLEDFGA